MNKYMKNNLYNYGSTAPADVYPEIHKPQKPQKEHQGRSRKRKKEEKRLIFIKRLQMIFMGIMVFISSIGFVWGSAIVSHKQHELKKHKTEIQNIKSEVNTTKSEIALATNLEYVKQRAITELNMLEPLAHQIVYLDIKKSSYTAINEINVAKK